MSAAVSYRPRKRVPSIAGLRFVLQQSGDTTSDAFLNSQGRLIVRVPPDAPLGHLEQVVKDHRPQILTDLALHSETSPLACDQVRPLYVPGIRLPHLGRRYVLQIDAQGIVPVEMRRGRLRMTQLAVDIDGETFLRTWYVNQALSWLARHQRTLVDCTGIEPLRFTVSDVGRDWAAWMNGRELHLNWRTIQLPSRIVEYVVVHELIHSEHPQHGPDFWSRMGRALPDFAERLQWLAENGSDGTSV